MAEHFLETARLRMIAATPALLTADLAGVQQLCAALGVVQCAEWPPAGSEYDEAAIRFFLVKLSTGGDDASGWYSWYAVLRDTTDHPGELAGNGGFFGPPDEEGSVEIGYSVCSKWRREGIATEIVRALLSHAWKCASVTKVMARTALDNPDSIGVLRRSGFQAVASEVADKLKFECLRKGSISTQRTEG